MSQVAGTEYAEPESVASQLGDDEFAALKREVAEWVTGPGEEYAERIEADGAPACGRTTKKAWLRRALPSTSTSSTTS